ncbi:MAG: hypothetical protein FK734_11040 [Asgard group archaeon]|nr:hypothetical protein [Asgard group archaeon]
MDSNKISYEIRNKPTEDINLKTSATSDAKTGYAIIVGISDYPGTNNDLSYCDDDAIEVRSMLINDYNFESSNIIYLQDSSATRDAISIAFDTIAVQADPNDVFFFYYSGHGGTELTTSTYSYSLSSPHNYPNNYNQYWSITHLGAIEMQVHFSRLETANYNDAVYVGDSDGYDDYFWDLYAGQYPSGLYSEWIPLLSDGQLVINLYSDGMYTDWGFEIDSYQVRTPANPQYLCPYDSISNEIYYYFDYLLDSKLDALPCAEKYVVSDSCNSGGMIPESQSAGRFIITACDNYESSIEDSGRSNGCFTYNFLNALDFATDSDENGVISMEEIYDYSYSTTASRSSNLGYTHHPLEYDGITGPAILQPALTSMNFNTIGNQLNYSYNLHGTGSLENLNLIIYYANSSGLFSKTQNIISNSATSTGFGLQNNITDISGLTGILSIEIKAEIQGNELITLNREFSKDADGDLLTDIEEYYQGTNMNLVDSDSDQLDDYEEVMIYFSNPLDPDSDDDGLKDGLEVSYGTEVLDPDTDGDGTLDGMEVDLGLDPLDPRSSMLTIVLNISGVVVLVVVGTYTTRATLIHSKQKKKDTKKLGGTFKINGVPENYNSLRVEETERQISRQPYGYYNRSIYKQTPQYGGIPRTIDTAQRAFINDFIQNQLPRPYSKDSIQGKKALVIGTLALKALNNMNIDDAVNYILTALKMGVPEPLNSQFKKLLLTAIDQGSIPNSGNFQFNRQDSQYSSSNLNSMNQTKICPNCGGITDSKNKFCTNCGRLI